MSEVERLTELSGIWSLEESTGCGNLVYDNHTRPIAFHPKEYRKRGKPASGKGHYYQCKRCGRRTLVSDPVRLHDDNRRYAVDLLARIANKSPIRGAVRAARLKSNQAHYQILDFVYRRCRAYNGAVDRALMEGRLRLPADLNIQSDAQVYQLNWVSRMDRRNVELSSYSTVHNESAFILGMHSNFDGRVDPFEINQEAAENGDLSRPEAFRKYAQYWLAGDELGAGRAMGRPESRRAHRPADPDRGTLHLGLQPQRCGEHRVAGPGHGLQHALSQQRSAGPHAVHDLRALVPDAPAACRRRCQAGPAQFRYRFNDSGSLPYRVLEGGQAGRRPCLLREVHQVGDHRRAPA